MIDADRIDNRRGQGTNLCRLARIAHERGELGRAQALYSRAVTTLDGVGDRTTTAYAEGVWGLYELEHGDRKEAMARLKNAATTLEQIGDKHYCPTFYGAVAHLLAVDGQMRRAETTLEQADDIARQQQDATVIAIIDLFRGCIEACEAKRASDDVAANLRASAAGRARAARRRGPVSEEHPDGAPPAVQLSWDLRCAMRLLQKELSTRWTGGEDSRVLA